MILRILIQSKTNQNKDNVEEFLKEIRKQILNKKFSYSGSKWSR